MSLSKQTVSQSINSIHSFSFLQDIIHYFLSAYNMNQTCFLQAVHNLTAIVLKTVFVLKCISVSSRCVRKKDVEWFRNYFGIY